MSATSNPADPSWLRLPDLERYAPVRGVGGVYRSAEVPGGSIGGVPLSSAEDAVVAAVRMGYRVAETHIDRAGRLAKRLRTAGEKSVGNEPERQAVDATEKLVGKALMAGLGWLEAVAAEPGSPLARFAAAQYRLLGGLFGVSDGGPSHSGFAREVKDIVSGIPVDAEAVLKRRKVSTRKVQVIHKGGAYRTVEVLGLHLENADAHGKFEPWFYRREDASGATFQAKLVVVAGEPSRLSITTEAVTVSGVWRAALCGRDGVQQGWLEVFI